MFKSMRIMKQLEIPKEIRRNYIKIAYSPLGKHHNMHIVLEKILLDLTGKKLSQNQNIKEINYSFINNLEKLYLD